MTRTAGHRLVLAASTLMVTKFAIGRILFYLTVGQHKVAIHSVKFCVIALVAWALTRRQSWARGLVVVVYAIGFLGGILWLPSLWAPSIYHFFLIFDLTCDMAILTLLLLPATGRYFEE